MDNIQRLEQEADLLFGNIAGWENSTLQRIGKRIGKYGKLSVADVKAINNIAAVKQDMDAITKELARVTGLNVSQVEKIYGDMIAEQHLANEPLYSYRGKKFVPFSENKGLQSIVRAYAKTTGETMVNLAKTKALCIMGANGKTIGMQKYYTDVLDKAVMKVASGALDFHTAMRDSIVELGGSGVRVDYGGGVTRRLDTVVRQNLLWGAKQASVEYNEMVGEELGCDGIEIDWHSNPRPSHEFMQGKQFVLGKARIINGVHFESADEALERLQDYGCLHYKTPIICGISEPRFSPEELKRLNKQNEKTYDIDGKKVSGYEATQMMRRLESGVREQKRIRDVARESGDALQVRRCNERIKLFQWKYDEISGVTGIAKETKRMSITKPKNHLTNKPIRGNIQTEISGQSKSNELKTKNIIKEAIALDKPVFTDDNYGRNASMVKKIDGVYDVIAHGSPKTIEYFKTPIDDETLAKILRGRNDYNGEPIRLLSCRLGEEKDGEICFAQRLANRLNVTVISPDNTIWVDQYGRVTIGPDSISNTGGWKTFEPQPKKEKVK